MSNLLTNKRVLLTGGTTGIGRATLLMLAKEEARVLTFGRDEAALEVALSAAREAGGDVVGFAADASDAADIEAVLSAAERDLGGIDILISNAALGAEPIHEMATDDWRNVVETNLVGSLAFAKGAITLMQRQGSGHLLFIGSIATEVKKPGESVYAATKAGIQAFAETLRKELQDSNIRVSVVQPGAVETDMQPGSDDEKQAQIEAGEMLHADDIAQAIQFVLTRPERANVVNLRVEPIRQQLG